MTPDPPPGAAGPSGVAITWLGQSAFRFTTPAGRTLLVDPWTHGNPACPPDLRDQADVAAILVTHGHHDHLGDAIQIAAAGSPEVVAVVELGKWLQGRGVRNVRTMNIGGVIEVEGVRVAMTPAAHTSSVDEDPFANVGAPAGYVLTFANEVRVYHAGDTAAFGGMEVIREVHAPQLAFLPCGDHHTMGPREAAVAARLVGAPEIVPMHYGVAPGSEGAPAALRRELDALGLGHLRLTPMHPGETIHRGP